MGDETGFSGAIRLAEIDDYIAPAQACVIPLLGSQTKKPTPGTAQNAQMETDEQPNVRTRNRRNLLNTVRLQGGTDDIGLPVSTEAVKISLNDCLACSGCITSAETILVEQQSRTQLHAALVAHRDREPIDADDKRLFVVTLSPQSLCSLATKYHLSNEATLVALLHYFHSYGVDYVFSSNFGRSFALLALMEECAQKYHLSKLAGNDRKRILPLLSSACPGWICYAEKTQGDVLPYISRVRSPQAINGAFIKSYLAKDTGVKPECVYHASVMPCFDKKLEASRSDFLLLETQFRETDCVISTSELLQLLSDDHFALNDAVVMSSKLHLTELDVVRRRFLCIDANGRLNSHIGGGSGGYAEHVLKMASRRLFPNFANEIEIKRTSRKDLEDMWLEHNGAIIFRVAKAYGFRNIQNLVQKLKRQNVSYDFVEVMACPSGCVNGGGQIRSVNPSERVNLLNQVTLAYNNYSAVYADEDPMLNDVLERWIGNLQSDAAQTLLFSDYHAVDVATSFGSLRW